MQSTPKSPLTSAKDVRRWRIQREAQLVLNTSITKSQSWHYVLKEMLLVLAQKPEVIQDKKLIRAANNVHLSFE